MSDKPGITIPIWLASIIAVAIIGGVTTLVRSQNENRFDVGILTVRIEGLSEQIKVSMDNRYRSSQAKSDFESRDVRINHNTEDIVALRLIIAALQKRIRELEGIVDKIENKTGD